MLYRIAIAFAALALLLAAAIGAEAATNPGTLTGKHLGYADGDTLTISGVRVRLLGIAAPERDELGGPEARRALLAIVAGKRITCRLTGERTFDRAVAVCRARSIDINRAMVANGWAAACPAFSRRYLAAEASAQAAKLGIWISGAYVKPKYC